MPFIPASLAEMMRSRQKDAEVSLTSLQPLVQKAVEMTFHLYNGALSNQSGDPSNFPLANLMSWSSEVEMVANSLYYAVTTLSGQQTIGEEYVNIVQVDGSMRYHPKLVLRFLMVIFRCIAPYLIGKLINRLKFYVNSNHWMAPSRKPVVIDKLECSDNVVQWVYRMHRSLFFLQISKEAISKDITSVSYITIRGAPMQHYRWFTFIGYLGLAQSAVSFYQALVTVKKMAKTAESEVTKTIEPTVSGSGAKCPLCFDQYSDITSTPCGHLFCWNCIYPWAVTKQCCPICRIECEPRGLVSLINFEL